jgi:hypothetical protein
MPGAKAGVAVSEIQNARTLAVSSFPNFPATPACRALAARESNRQGPTSMLPKNLAEEA